MPLPKRSEIEWVTTDCYGTLIDWEKGISEAFEREDREEATGRYPELANAYALEELAAQFARDNLEEAVRAAFEGGCGGDHRLSADDGVREWRGGRARP